MAPLFAFTTRRGPFGTESKKDGSDAGQSKLRHQANGWRSNCHTRGDRSRGCGVRLKGLALTRHLLVLAVPVSLIEPLKLAAVAIAGKGHWLVGTVVIVCAYAAKHGRVAAGPRCARALAASKDPCRVRACLAAADGSAARLPLYREAISGDRNGRGTALAGRLRRNLSMVAALAPRVHMSSFAQTSRRYCCQ